MPPCPNAIAQFVHIKMQFLVDMRAHKLEFDLLTDPRPTLAFSKLLDMFTNLRKVVCGWDPSVYGAAQCIIEVTLTAIDATTVVERGWRTTNYIHSPNSAGMHVSALEDRMSVLSHAPPPP